jgi:putative SOS response-associated peptidase YedK
MAGFYTDGGEERPATCAIITTAPNEVMTPIHNRMPAILNPALEAMWTDPRVVDPAVVLSCLRPYPADAMIAFPMALLVSSPHNDGPALIQPMS